MMAIAWYYSKKGYITKGFVKKYFSIYHLI